MIKAVNNNKVNIKLEKFSRVCYNKKVELIFINKGEFYGNKIKSNKT